MTLRQEVKEVLEPTKVLIWRVQCVCGRDEMVATERYAQALAESMMKTLDGVIVDEVAAVRALVHALGWREHDEKTGVHYCPWCLRGQEVRP